MMLRVIRNLLLGLLRLLLLLLLRRLGLRWWWWRWSLLSLDLLDVGRLVLRRTLRGWVLWRRVVRLCRALRRHRLMGRVGVVVLLVLVDHARPRMVHRKMVWRWQALGRVWVML